MDERERTLHSITFELMTVKFTKKSTNRAHTPQVPLNDLCYIYNARRGMSAMMWR